MTIQKVIDIFKKYNFKDSEINVALKFLKKIIECYSNLNENRLY